MRRLLYMDKDMGLLEAVRVFACLLGASLIKTLEQKRTRERRLLAR